MNLTISIPLSTILSNVGKQTDSEILSLALLVCEQLARELEAKLRDSEIRVEELEQQEKLREKEMEWKYFTDKRAFAERQPTVILLENDLGEQFVGSCTLDRSYHVVSLRTGGLGMTWSGAEVMQQFKRYILLLP